MSKYTRGRTAPIDKRVVVCETTEIDKFPEGRIRFLDLIGVKGALITDRSQVLDFGVSRQVLNTLSQATGYCVTSSTLVWKVCRDLEER